jgi:phage/plasmid-associated DNA primase
MIKRITGRDSISARLLYSNKVIEFIPVCKSHIIANHKPQFDVDDSATKSRVVLLPWNAYYDPENKKESEKYIDELKNKHLDEILSWLCEGAWKWYQKGTLPPLPSIVINEMNELYTELDTVQSFLSDTFEILQPGQIGFEDPNNRIQSTHLYDEYKKWCIDQGKTAVSIQKFKTSVTKKHVQMKKISCMMWIGLKRKNRVVETVALDTTNIWVNNRY